MKDFGEKLAALISTEVATNRGNPEYMADIIERLSAAIGFTAAIVAKGHGPTIDEIITGAEAHAHEEAVHKAPLGKMMAQIRAERQPF